jgi:DNA segregation ATPase FtsK/SpoIIIE, S-DNA-T family
MTDATASDFLASPGRLPAFVRRNLLRLGGIALLAAVAALVAALATWHADDPSLSYAADIGARNLLGYPGAILADLAMQFLGLAVIGWLAPPALVGWGLARLRPPRRARWQAAFWLVGTCLLATALACAPSPSGWPLPIGLGGVVGDVTLRLVAQLFADDPGGGVYAAIAVVTGGLALGLLYAACAVRPGEAPAAGSGMARARRRGREEDLDEADQEGRLRLVLGALAHMALSARAFLRRRLGQRRARARQADDWPGAEAAAGSRREPRLGGWAPEDELEEEIGAAAREATGRSAGASRVARPAPRPQPGRRAAREAQPSLLPSSDYELPPLHLLSEPAKRGREAALDPESLEQNARVLEGVLEDFGVRGEIINIRPGPVVTLYELEPAPGIKSSRVIGLADDIARSMSAIACRVAVVPGRNAIGIELPNIRRETVFLREILASTDFEKTRARLALSLGKSIGGEPVIADLAKMPHLLVAGTTGSGKSVSINTMILSILYRLTPEQCRLIMIDPKMLELSVYDGIPHLLTPVVTDPRKAVVALKWTVREMEERYRKMSKLGVRNIDGFNQRVALAKKKGEVITRTVQTGFDHESGEAVFETEELDLEPMPYIVVIIDEMADLMMVAGKDIEGAVQRLAQMARAAGIHVIMATQRPSVDVITGTIKANFPTRISFQVTSKIDSRTILGEQGAEQLLGMGDMLYMAGGGRIQRVHGAFVTDEEVEDVVAHLKAQGVPEYLDSITDEDEEGGGAFDIFGGGMEESGDLYDQAVAVVLRDRKVSTSYVQRRLGVGYNRAASLVERMEKEGIISAANHAGKREILVGEEGGAAA